MITVHGNLFLFDSTVITVHGNLFLHDSTVITVHGSLYLQHYIIGGSTLHCDNCTGKPVPTVHDSTVITVQGNLFLLFMTAQ